MTTFFAAFIGLLLGRLAAGWAAELMVGFHDGDLLVCSSCSTPVPARRRWFSCLPIRCHCESARVVRWHLWSALILAGLFGLFSWLLLDCRCQTVDEVRPATALIYGRLPFHLSLIFLLWVATLTDLLDYVIADPVVMVGIVIAVVAAWVTGELQTIHVWVNWDDAIEGLRGPYLPQWMKDYQHLHGLVWSIAGLVTGAGLTWIVRRMSHAILGHPALGLGDVTLMAMIGAYIGWQPTLCVLAIAPLTSVVAGVFVQVICRRSFVAYGPYLALSAYIVICTWRWLWADYFTLRDIFSHWPSVAGLICLALFSLAILLGLLRLFRAMPVSR